MSKSSILEEEKPVRAGFRFVTSQCTFRSCELSDQAGFLLIEPQNFVLCCFQGTARTQTSLCWSSACVSITAGVFAGGLAGHVTLTCRFQPAPAS